jgi:hypothetical protein
MCGVRLRVAGTEPPPPEPPPLPDQATLVPVTWNGIDLNPGYRDDGLLVIVTDLTGWYGTPALNGRDLDRAIADGAIFGPKTLGPRLIAIEGAVQGPRGACLDFSRELARLASERGTDQRTHAWSGPNLFRYQVTVTAADPRLYTQDWQTALLQTGAGIDTGREYPREYPWAYGASDIPNSARVTNPGNTDAPVWAAYQGPLGESRLAAGERYIRVAALSDGQQLTVNCETLAAWAPGGAARASYILGGSQPLIPAPRSSDLWRLTATGTGSVRLQWRGAFA